MTDENETPVQEPQQKNDRSTAYIVLIVILVLACGYLVFSNHRSSQVVTAQTQTLNTDSIHIVDLDARYHSEMDSLYSYKGQNASLDTILNNRIAKLSEMEKNLAIAKRNGKLAADQYQKSIDTLNTMVGDLKNQIADLQSQNHVLIVKNDSLGTSLTTAVTTNQQLTTTNTTLSTKLTKASLLVPQNFTSEAVKLTSSGKERTTANDKKAKRVRINFDVPANNDIDAGDKTFYLVLTDPKGNVLSDVSQGSGLFKLAEINGTDTIGQQEQYTLAKTVPYNLQTLHVEMEWTNPSGFVEGNYIAEVYQDGYLTGKGTLRLK